MRLIVAYSASGLVHLAAIAGLAYWAPRGDSWRTDIAIARGDAICIAASSAAYEVEAVEIEAVSVEAEQPFPRIDVVPPIRPLTHSDDERVTVGPAELPLSVSEIGADVSHANDRPLAKLSVEQFPDPPKQLERKIASAALPFQTAVHIGAQVDELPRKLPANASPVYPADALSAGVQGRVLLKVDVQKDGGVSSARIEASSGHPSLDQAALAAVRNWRFDPARRAGIAVAYEVLVPVRFSIR